MRPADKKTDDELLAWAAGLLRRAQERQLFGQVTFHLEAGRVVRARTETSERPEDED